MLEVLQHLLSRKTRTVFSILGVTIGVFSLLVMGSMAEHFNALSRHYKSVFANKLFVCKEANFWEGAGVLHQSKVTDIDKVDGVQRAVPIVTSSLGKKQLMIAGGPRVLVGIDAKDSDILYDKKYLYTGMWLDKDDYDAVLGWDIARQFDKKENDKTVINNYPFTVKGIMKKTGSLEDNHAVIPLSVAQKILAKEGFITAVIVSPARGVDLDSLAQKIRTQVRDVEVVTPGEFENQLKQSLVIWNIITLGTSLLAAITGALCIIMTLLVAVNDRVPEIGLKKAIGATSIQIMQEYLLEAIFLSFAGWLFGTILGSIFIKLFENYTLALGTSLFELSARVLVLSLLWSVCIGVLAGLYPSWRAASINPIKAMRR